MVFAVVDNFNYTMEYGDVMILVSISLLTVSAHGVLVFLSEVI